MLLPRQKVCFPGDWRASGTAIKLVRMFGTRLSSPLLSNIVLCFSSMEFSNIPYL